MPGRIRRKRKFQTITWAVISLLVVLGWWAEQRLLRSPNWQPRQGQPRQGQPRQGQPRQGLPGPLPAGTYRVRRVIDGDTIVLVQDDLHVRLQGIDTPETVREDHPVEPWGPEASAYTRAFIAAAHGQVELTFEGETLDRYGRHLAFVWAEGRGLNEELVRQGLAHAKTGYPFSQAMKTRLRQAERAAQAARVGIWSAPAR